VSDHPLDTDTALEPLTPTRWRGTISDRWWVTRAPFGGYVATFLTRALVAAVDDPARRPRSLTVHFVEAPEAGPVEVCARVERVGRSSTSVSLRLEQEGRPVALALGSSATWRDGEPEWTEDAPSAPPPEDCERLERRDPMPGFLDRLEVRPVTPIVSGEPRNLAWMRLDPPRVLDHLAMTALADGWMPAAFSKLGRPVGAPTVDLTIHFRAPLASAADWVLADYRSRFSAGGAWEEDGELWAADGTLLAQSRQLALIRS
jgi:acyl-CoA thioesterase